MELPTWRLVMGVGRLDEPDDRNDVCSEQAPSPTSPRIEYH